LIGLPSLLVRAAYEYPFAARPLFADPPGSIVPRGRGSEEAEGEGGEGRRGWAGRGAGNNAAPCSSIRRHNHRAGLFFNWISAHDDEDGEDEGGDDGRFASRVRRKMIAFHRDE